MKLNRKQIKKLLVDNYKERLTPNKIEEDLKELDGLKEFLFKQRLDSAKRKKSGEWNLGELEKVLNHLPNGKSRDLYGHTYEIFKYSGMSLKISLLRMANFIKEKQKYPRVLLPATITSIFKGKGDRSDPNMDRGVFNLIKARSIIDRLIYNDNYPVIDASMSCSNIGARKNRNIRDHLFILNSVLHEISRSKHHADIQI